MEPAVFIKEWIQQIIKNYDWLFSGIGVEGLKVMGILILLGYRFLFIPKKKEASVTTKNQDNRRKIIIEKSKVGIIGDHSQINEINFK